MKKGDFTNLADDYAKFRPSYNKDVVKLIISAVNNNLVDMQVADVGAGTGIFTKCLIDAGVKNIVAVEPNEKMRKAGIKFLGDKIEYRANTAESTGLESKSVDLVSMASSFHWTQPEDALREFDRILSPEGIFSALWNPRLTEHSSIENEVQKLLENKYGICSRMSSGLSGITSELNQLLRDSGVFKSVVYAEATNVVQRTREQYLGAWRSVNDIQAQLGQMKFSNFIKDIESIIGTSTNVEVHYLTRAWIAQKDLSN